MLLTLSLLAFSCAAPDTTPLQRAVANGDAKAVKRLLKGSVPSTQEAADALVSAAGAGRLEMVEVLLRGGVSPDAHSSQGQLTALILSSYSGEEKVVRRLLAAKANPNELNDDHESALHTSAAAANADVLVPLLLAAKADWSVLDKFGRTPLLVHAQAGHLGAVNALLGAGADPLVVDEDGQSALFLSAMKGHTAVVKRLLQQDRVVDRPNRFGATPLVAAAAGGFLQTLQLLAASGANLRATTKEGQGALGLAVEQNEVTVVAWLATRIPVNQPNHPVGPALHVAAVFGHRALVPVLVKAGARMDVEAGHLTPLHIAVAKGHVDFVRDLLDAGADPNGGGTEGAPPLSLAALMGEVPMVELLLQKGAALNGRNPQGGTALRAASAKGHIDVVRLLLAKGAESRSADTYGKRPIDYARENNYSEIVTMLDAAKR